MSFHRTVRVLAIVVVTAGSAALGQSKGPGASNNGGSRGTGTGTAPPTTQTLPGQLNQLIMVSGKVITADGSPLPEPVALEQVCNGHVMRRGRSDFRGYFSVDIGRSFFPADNAEGSAETSSGRSFSMIDSRMTPSSSPLRTWLSSCELRGYLAGFRSSSVRIPLEEVGSGMVGTINIGTIVLQRMGEVQGTTVSATSLNAPKEARKAFDKGHQAVAQNKPAEAQSELEKAVRLYPQYASAWVDLGWVYSQQNQIDKARNAFQQAHAADEKFVPAYVGLASLAVRESKWQEAAEQSAQATRLDGVDFPAAFYYNSLANYRLGNMEQAEKSARQAETLGVQRAFPQVSLLLGVMLANKLEYADAAEQLRSYLKAAPTAPNADKVRLQLAEVERLQAAGSKAAPAPLAK